MDLLHSWLRYLFCAATTYGILVVMVQGDVLEEDELNGGGISRSVTSQDVLHIVQIISSRKIVIGLEPKKEKHEFMPLVQDKRYAPLAIAIKQQKHEHKSHP